MIWQVNIVCRHLCNEFVCKSKSLMLAQHANRSRIDFRRAFSSANTVKGCRPNIYKVIHRIHQFRKASSAGEPSNFLRIPYRKILPMTESKPGTGQGGKKWTDLWMIFKWGDPSHPSCRWWRPVTRVALRNGSGLIRAKSRTASWTWTDDDETRVGTVWQSPLNNNYFEIKFPFLSTTL